MLCPILEHRWQLSDRPVLVQHVYSIGWPILGQATRDEAFITLNKSKVFDRLRQPPVSCQSNAVVLAGELENIILQLTCAVLPTEYENFALELGHSCTDDRQSLVLDARGLELAPYLPRNIEHFEGCCTAKSEKILILDFEQVVTTCHKHLTPNLVFLRILL